MPGAITIATNMAGRGTDIQLGGNVEMRVKRRSCADLEPGPEREAKRSAKSAAEVAAFQGQGDRRRRPLYHRHRAARKPPHRQSAARPFRPPGRSGPLEILPVAQGRSDADLRLRPDGRHAQQARPPGGRGDRPSLDQQGAGKGAAKGRGAQLRHAQEHSEIRQRHERPAQGRLRAAPRDDGAGVRRRDDRRHARRSSTISSRATYPGERLSRAWDIAGIARKRCKPSSTSTCRSPIGPRKKGSPTRKCASGCARRPTKPTAARVEKNGPEITRYVEKQMVLQALDHLWREHLVTLDHLRQVVGWRGKAQRDPLNEYKAEAFELFEEMTRHLREARHRPDDARRGHGRAAAGAGLAADGRAPCRSDDGRGRACAGGCGLCGRRPPRVRSDSAPRDPNNPATWGRVGRNEACPCGSGKKYKHCHGQLA